MFRTFACSMLAVLVAMTGSRGAEPQKDTDGNGIWDQHEEILGTDPGSSDRFQVVLEGLRILMNRSQGDSEDHVNR